MHWSIRKNIKVNLKKKKKFLLILKKILQVVNNELNISIDEVLQGIDHNLNYYKYVLANNIKILTFFF